MLIISGVRMYVYTEIGFKPSFRHFLLVRANPCVGNGSSSREILGHVHMDFTRENSLKNGKCDRTLM